MPPPTGCDRDYRPRADRSYPRQVEEDFPLGPPVGPGGPVQAEMPLRKTQPYPSYRQANSE